MSLFHTKKNCIKNGIWESGIFVCCKCNSIIAYAYKTENGINVVNFPNYKNAIVKKPDSYLK